MIELEPVRPVAVTSDYNEIPRLEIIGVHASDELRERIPFEESLAPPGMHSEPSEEFRDHTLVDSLPDELRTPGLGRRANSRNRFEEPFELRDVLPERCFVR